MTRQTTQELITALYPRLSHEDELQGESNSISNHEFPDFVLAAEKYGIKVVRHGVVHLLLL